ncbi:MAG: hypothetical protein IJ745_07330 [Bacteroidales bacterium]|nr:hypothetical protein [Bacteroidales bacterium]
MPPLRVLMQGGAQRLGWPNAHYSYYDDDEWGMTTSSFQHGVAYFFPILTVDCHTPQVDTSVVGGNNVKLEWEAGRYDSCWLVSYGPAGTPPGDGILWRATSPIYFLTGLQYDTPYVAYVQSVCVAHDGVHYSDWSDSISILLPSPAGLEAPETSAPAVTLAPNPADDEVSVLFGPAPAGRVTLTLVDAGGREALRREWNTADGPALLSLRSLPKGSYLLLVSGSVNASRQLVVH